MVLMSGKMPATPPPEACQYEVRVGMPVTDHVEELPAFHPFIDHDGLPETEARVAVADKEAPNVRVRGNEKAPAELHVPCLAVLHKFIGAA